MEEKKKSCQVPGYSAKNQFMEISTQIIDNTEFLKWGFLHF